MNGDLHSLIWENIKLIGESYRFRQRMQTGEEEDESDPNAIKSGLGWGHFRYEFLMF